MNSNLFYSKDKKSILFFVTIEMIYHPCYKPSHPFYRRHTGNMKGPALRRKHGTPILPVSYTHLTLPTTERV